MKEFAKNFKLLRIERNLTQEKVAQIFNVSKSTIAMWETGRREPNIDKIEEIADFFNVDMKFLRGKQEEKRIVNLDSYQPIVDFTNEEILLIEMFRDSDQTTKEMVSRILKFSKIEEV